MREKIRKNLEHVEIRIISDDFIEDKAKNKLDKTKPSEVIVLKNK